MKTGAQSRQATPQNFPTSSRAIPSASQSAVSPLFRMQRTIGNQALAGLLASGRIQPKLKATSPSDSDQESDLNPRSAFRFPRTPVIQRKCACGGSCAKCSAEEEETRAPRLQLSPVSPRLQRAAKDAVAQPEAKAVPESDRGPTLGLIVEDEASIGSPRQMKKSAFFALLEADICATADAELAAVGRSSNSCPYIRKWIAFYREQTAAHVERALLKYAPEATNANTARDYIVVVRHRVRRAVALWAKTGRITGIPPGVGLMPSGGEGGKGTSKNEGFGTGLLRAVSTAGRAQFKERDGAITQPTDAESVRDQLGHGRPLDSRTRGRMESAFGSDFSSVRVHDDSSSWGLSSRLNARAFTVGNNVAFGAGEYRPGTLVGDALIAHELAHVVQQGAASQSNAPMLKGDGDYDALEADADLSAVGAVASLFAGAKGKLADIGRNAMPRLKSGLRLQRCQAGVVALALETAEVGVVTTEVAVPTAIVATPEVVGGAAVVSEVTAGTTTALATGTTTAATTTTVASTTAAATTAASTTARLGLAAATVAATQLQDEPTKKEKCTDAEKAALYAEVKASCDRVRACSMQTDTCATATEKVSALYACISARERYQKKCFSPGDPGYEGHMRQIAQMYAALRTCDTVMKEKCK